MFRLLSLVAAATVQRRSRPLAEKRPGRSARASGKRSDIVFFLWLFFPLKLSDKPSGNLRGVHIKYVYEPSYHGTTRRKETLRQNQERKKKEASLLRCAGLKV